MIYFPHKYCWLLLYKYEPMKADIFTVSFSAELTWGLSTLSSAGGGQLFRWAMLPMIMAMVSSAWSQWSWQWLKDDLFQFNWQLQADPNHPWQGSGSKVRTHTISKDASNNLKREPAIMAKPNHLIIVSLQRDDDFYCLYHQNTNLRMVSFSLGPEDRPRREKYTGQFLRNTMISI